LHGADANGGKRRPGGLTSSQLRQRLGRFIIIVAGLAFAVGFAYAVITRLD